MFLPVRELPHAPHPDVVPCPGKTTCAIFQEDA